MRICLISLDFKPYRSSGLTIYAEDLARGLACLGNEITVLAAHHPGLPKYQMVDNIMVFRLPYDRLDWITYSARVGKFLPKLTSQRSFDIVHFLDVGFAYCYSGSYVASIWQSFRQRLTARGGQPYSISPLDGLRRQVYYRIARHWMETPSVQRASRLISSCQSTSHEYITHYRADPNRIELVYQGIDTEFFKPVPAKKVRTQLGLDGCRILFFAGFITPRKGMEYLGRAMQMLPEDVHLVIMGRWEKGYRGMFLRSLGNAMSRVHELGYVTSEDRPLYYSLADIYVSPSYLEGLGITPIEAMACETPAVVTSATSGPEEVGEAGLVVPPRDAEALAHALLTLLDNPDLRHHLGKMGRARAVQNFSYLKMAELTQQSYQKALG